MCPLHDDDDGDAPRDGDGRASSPSSALKHYTTTTTTTVTTTMMMSTSQAAHRAPETLRASAASAHAGARQVGPCEAEAIAGLRAAAARRVAEAAAAAARRAEDEARGARFATTTQTMLAAPPTLRQQQQGAGGATTSLGARVMRTQDGQPATRDPAFLAEAGLLGRPAADRMLRRMDALRRRAPAADGGHGDNGHDASSGSAATATRSSVGGAAADEPAITIYGYGGPGVAAQRFYGTAGPKRTPMARSDAFTKLAGDVNAGRSGGDDDGGR